MLFKRGVLEAIARGEVTQAYRYWRRPTVKPGGSLMTERGQLRILDIQPVDACDLGPRDARAAGYPTLEALLRDLAPKAGATLFRIRFEVLGPDPRLSLRGRDDLADSDAYALWTSLGRMDKRSPVGPWTTAVLSAIEKQPGMRAAELAQACGLEKEWLKRHVRQLKNLGLTESLNPGYRISPRGKALLRRPRD
jgi:hypothetical protein